MLLDNVYGDQVPQLTKRLLSLLERLHLFRSAGMLVQWEWQSISQRCDFIFVLSIPIDFRLVRLLRLVLAFLALIFLDWAEFEDESFHFK